jgi:hypothetical protein
MTRAITALAGVMTPGETRTVQSAGYRNLQEWLTEGRVNETTHLVNSMRKDAGRALTDRISLWLAARLGRGPASAPELDRRRDPRHVRSGRRR